MKTWKTILALAIGAIATAPSTTALTVERLKVEGLRNPRLIDVAEPSFSWALGSDERAVVQTSYRIIVATDSSFGQVVWDSGTVESPVSVAVPSQGISLQPSTLYYWQVTVTDNKGHEATSEGAATFHTGLMGTGWEDAKWIKASELPKGTVPTPSEPIGDYTVEATVEIEHTAAGLCFAAADGDNFYMWQLNTEGTYPRLRPHRWQGGNPACLDNVDLRGKADLAEGKPCRLRIEVTQGGRLATTYIDDVKVDSRNGDFAYGLVGIRQDKGESDGQPETAFFDDILVTAGSRVLLEEDFSSATPAIEGGEIADGRLYVVGSTQHSVYAWQRDGGTPVHYTVEADMTLMADNAAIVFASTGPRTYLMWQINTSDAATHPIVRRHIYNNALRPQFSDVTATAFTKADILGKEHHITIEVDGKTITTFIDGVKVDTYTDHSGVVGKGDIGFRVDNSAHFRDNAYFDNVKVTEYYPDGTSAVTLREDFEQLPSPYFYDAIVESVDGNNKLYMPIRGIETRVMQRAGEGAPMFRRSFRAEGEIKQAILYTSALGVYDLFLNNTRVGHLQPDGTTVYEELKPGRADYNHRVNYSMHDVTHLVTPGDNALGAIVTDGWWRGDVAHGAYGNPTTAFLARLHIVYTDGSEQNIVSDGSWSSSRGGAMRSGDIYNGEIYDARLLTDWTSGDFDDSTWQAVEYSNEFSGVVEASCAPAVEALAELAMTPVSATVFRTPAAVADGDFGMIEVLRRPAAASPLTLRKGESVIFDFGQNFAGWTDMQLKGTVGNRVRLRFSEMLNDTGEKSRGNDGPGGSLYLLNLRSANAELFYTLAGRPEGESYHPSMTFYGFRYCEITATDDVEIISLKGIPVSTRMDDTGTFACSHPDVNRLYSNIVWSQRSNFLSIPTDCPQRDERLGWAADTQIFAPTAMFNSDAAPFYRHWMQTMRDGQSAEGAYPNVSPWESWDGHGAGAWSDAGIIVPWTVYRMSGDTKIIEENFESMERYMDWLSRQHGDGYTYQGAGTTFGDWLAFTPTDSRYVSVCYYACDARMMADMARAMSKGEGDIHDLKSQKYDKLFQSIKTEFGRRYLSNGVPTQRTMTGYLLALKFGLLPDADAETRTAQALEKAITANGETLNTGFVGTGILNTTLSEWGLTHKAYNLLLQRRCPSWLYSVDQGATTTWERWDSYRLDTGFGDYSMNSFNHYAYGAVGEWMYRFMAGIDTHPESAGFSHIVLRPSPDLRTALPAGQNAVTQASATYHSPRGTIISGWCLDDGGGLRYEATVPANTTATLYLPLLNDTDVVYEGATEAGESEGVELIGLQPGMAVLRLASGHYSFSARQAGSDCISADTAQIKVYPVPAHDVIHISAPTEIVSVQIFDTTGAAVASTNYCPEGTVDVSDLRTGLYIIHVHTSSATHTAKIIKQ